ncbi:hypothetical protein [Oryzomonas rubra]|uniref:Uncharacterized protein n=1 Tax=Oryzomonas rubra TaxID=2509454 RepID=A0A5A9X7K5_9BACT|nr:hypothetical protein [Oryzomonas rubra]KAA0888365.1 hypothetical protein ET418_16675 [Oryzomonas rubra]
MECHTSLSALNASKASPAIDASALVVSAKFLKSAHTAKGCPSCHGGNPLSRAKAGAHKKLVADPLAADGGRAVCGKCHTDIVMRHKSSLHYTTQGIKNAFFGRLSKDDSTCKMAKAAWRSKACVDCHASCGTCHVTKPRSPWVISGPKGLLSGHEFQRFEKKTDAEKTCYVCHAGSITDPEAGFQKYDVHNKAGMTCMSCHTEKEVHGDGVTRQTMINSGAVTTECKQCHEKITGRWHSQSHLDRATCQSCHSMPYRSCTECHGWQRIVDKASPPFRITYSIKLGVEHGKLTTLVKAPVDPKMLADEGLPEIPANKLTTQSSWYAGVPHNVIRPKPNQELCDRCHGPGTALLKENDLQFPDHEKKHIMTPRPPVDATNIH